MTVQSMVRSDHCLLALDLSSSGRRMKRCFKFERFWVEHPDFLEVVLRSWSSSCDMDGSDLAAGFAFKLACCARALDVWGKRVFPNCSKLISELKQRLTDVSDDFWSPEKVVLVKNLEADIEQAWKVEEEYWGQRARLNWAKYGDRDSFFMLFVCREDRRIKLQKLKALMAFGLRVRLVLLIVLRAFIWSSFPQLVLEISLKLKISLSLLFLMRLIVI